MPANEIATLITFEMIVITHAVPEQLGVRREAAPAAASTPLLIAETCANATIGVATSVRPSKRPLAKREKDMGRELNQINYA